MQLCRDVGYKRMRLPNLLEHETMAEAKQQASSWVPLLAKQCHTDTQLFLCSLFAPVCLDRPVYPCRSLCEVVRDSCAPVMESYGFPWPEMLHCGKFPSDHELCIAVQFGNSKVTPPPVSKICTQCEMEHKADGMMEQMCSTKYGGEKTEPAGGEAQEHRSDQQGLSRARTKDHISWECK
ncbi:secreted frizzled-related protein 5 [Limosa lapponica baueri]|uniref:Secreted frizzled-related protein 5 n=1 Tax=Limosa lapponica baueri TaxID=1758121 RepID=A0A2I0T3Z7_LIMLA|nr:secreted frizzled-related protein 5 [Limosa lapponica baueri]